jgi:glycosyltransferase involved in cell wall biosynthesis
MKILMLGWELPPYNSGGLGVACYHLCRNLAKSGNEVEFILPYDAEHNIDFMKITPAIPQGIKDLRLQMLGVYNSYLYKNESILAGLSTDNQQDVYASAVDEILQDGEFDIIHAHDWLTFRAALRAKEKSSLPLILHVHSVESDRAGGGYGNPLVREIEETALNLADQVIAVSQLTKDAIVRDYGVPPDKIEVVHNSIDPDTITELDNQNAYKYLTQMRQKGYRVVTSVGRLTIQKGLPNLLRAAKLVIDKCPKTLFLIVGSGEQYFELIELAADLGISKNVIFTGFLRGKDWRDSFGAADLFVLPSVSEPFGISPLEAIGYGTPVLLSKQSGVSEVLNNCLKVDYWDIYKMSDQICGVILSDVLQKELSLNALAEFSKLSWQPIADAVLKIYQIQLMGSRI